MQLTSAGISRPITQEVPIDIKPAEDISLAEPPQLPKPEVNVYLPPLKTVKNVVDKMKSLRFVIARVSFVHINSDSQQ
jgi:HUS1 checkpoint protein